MSKKERFTRWYRDWLNAHARGVFFGTLTTAFVGAMWWHPLYWIVMGYSILSLVWQMTWNKKYK